MVSTIDVGCATLHGNRYGDLNQDYVVTKKVFSSEELQEDDSKKQCYLGSVLDGHGLLGEMIAKQAGDVMLKDLASCLQKAPLSEADHQALEKMFVGAFQEAHNSTLGLYEDPPEDVMYPKTSTQKVHFKLHHKYGMALYKACGLGNMNVADRLLECGSTCSVVAAQGDVVVVANVGDSMAVMGCYDVDDDVVADVLTTTHCGLNPEEAARIEGGFSEAARIIPRDGYLSITAGMWAGYELSVTRALGHKHLAAHGVTPEPYVNVMRLRGNECCLVVASDGVWDVMTPREVVNRVMEAVSEGKDAAGAAQQLVADAVSLAQGGNSDADNTSAVVYLFE